MFDAILHKPVAEQDAGQRGKDKAHQPGGQDQPPILYERHFPRYRKARGQSDPIVEFNEGEGHRNGRKDGAGQPIGSRAAQCVGRTIVALG